MKGQRSDAQLLANRDSPEATRLLVERYDSLATGLASRFTHRAERADLEQVARLGLVAAIERFDPSRGTRLSTYATHTILGELRRHLRDKTWSVRVPRSLQEAWMDVAAASERLTHDLKRSPTIQEIADAVGMSQEDVLEAMDAGDAHQTASLDVPVEGRAANTKADTVPAQRKRERRLDEKIMIYRQLERLDERDRMILYLRFFEDRSQQEIADEVGVSQMHVSRLLRRAIHRVRDAVNG